MFHTRSTRLCLLGSFALMATPFVCAQRPATPPANPQAQTSTERPTLPIPPEKASVTQHELTLDGATLHYTATMPATCGLMETTLNRTPASFMSLTHWMASRMPGRGRSRFSTMEAPVRPACGFTWGR